MFGGDGRRMQMEDRIHLRLPYGVKMHQVAVIGQQIVVGMRPEGVLRVAVVVTNLEIENVAGERGGQAKGVINVCSVGPGFDVPPLVTAVDDQGCDRQGDKAGDEGPPACGWAARHAWAETRLANGS